MVRRNSESDDFEGAFENGVEHDVDARAGTLPGFDPHSEDAWGNENSAHEESPLVYSVLQALVNSGLGVPVEVTQLDEGAVRLEGEAPSVDARHKVEQVTRAVAGVRDVDNALVVRDSASP